MSVSEGYQLGHSVLSSDGTLTIKVWQGESGAFVVKVSPTETYRGSRRYAIASHAMTASEIPHVLAKVIADFLDDAE